MIPEKGYSRMDRVPLALPLASPATTLNLVANTIKVYDFGAQLPLALHVVTGAADLYLKPVSSANVANMSATPTPGEYRYKVDAANGGEDLPISSRYVAVQSASNQTWSDDFSIVACD